MTPHKVRYKVKVFYEVDTRGSGVVEETGIIHASDQWEYSRKLGEFKKRLARTWDVSQDRITPRTAKLLEEAPQ